MAEQERVAALGKAIAIRRVELGLSRNDLRDRSGLSYPYVAELEKGTKSPSARALEAIAGALEMRPHELMARAEELGEPPPPPPMMSAPRTAPQTVAYRRWFGAAADPASGDQAPQPAEPLTEERVRVIVREELRRLLGEASK